MDWIKAAFALGAVLALVACTPPRAMDVDVEPPEQINQAPPYGVDLPRPEEEPLPATPPSDIGPGQG